MVIHDFQPLRAALSPDEADSPLVVDADAVLPGTYDDLIAGHSTSPAGTWSATLSEPVNLR